MINIDCLSFAYFLSTLGDSTLYDQLNEHILTKDLLKENNYPHKHPDKTGFAVQYGDAKKGNTDGKPTNILIIRNDLNQPRCSSKKTEECIRM